VAISYTTSMGVALLGTGDTSPAAHRRIVASAIQVPLAKGKVPCSIFEKLHHLEPPYGIEP